MGSEPTVVRIRGEYITLGQFLKLVGAIDSGWEAKLYLSDHVVVINGEEDDRRGRKIRPGDGVVLDSGQEFDVQGDE